MQANIEQSFPIERFSPLLQLHDESEHYQQLKLHEVQADQDSALKTSKDVYGSKDLL